MVCFKVEMWLPYRRLLERHGVALLLFPPLLSILVDHANKARGRVSASSQRNCAARVNHVALALCRWLKCVFLPPLLPIYVFPRSFVVCQCCRATPHSPGGLVRDVAEDSGARRSRGAQYSPADAGRLSPEPARPPDWRGRRRLPDSRR